jgi:hypothetical protein
MFISFSDQKCQKTTISALYISAFLQGEADDQRFFQEYEQNSDQNAVEVTY